MDRITAVDAIRRIVKSGILDTELEETLSEVAEHICDGAWEDCETMNPYCEGCKHRDDLS